MRTIFHLFILAVGIFPGILQAQTQTYLGTSSFATNRANSNPSQAAIEIRELNRGLRQTGSLGEAPSIGFHWGDRNWGHLLLDTSGAFRFMNWDKSEYAALFVSSLFTSSNVGIGTTNLTAKLTVAGDIKAREIKVEANAGADFVFAEDYRLRSLPEVEQFITQNKHLPDIAPANEMIEKGIDMGEMQIKLLQKIEELTLYMIEQQKQNESLKQQIQTQQKQIDALQKSL